MINRNWVILPSSIKAGLIEENGAANLSRKQWVERPWDVLYGPPRVSLGLHDQVPSKLAFRSRRTPAPVMLNRLRALGYTVS